MKEIKDILFEQPFFRELTPEMVDYIAGCGQNMHFSPGDFLGKEGGPADYLYLIRKGKVAVELNPPGRGALTIRTLSPGEICGFSWIIPPYRMQFNLKALEHTSVVALDGNCIRKKCEEDHETGYLLMKESAAIMERRLQDTRIQLLDVYGTSN